MKLFHNVMLHISVASVVIMTAWSVFFYWAIIDEVNDEVDDSLEDYSETLIIRSLRGDDLPSVDNGSNNQFYIYDVTEEYAKHHPNLIYKDGMVYIEEKLETEPARILITIFKTESGYKELVVYTPTIDKLDLQKAILGWVIFLYISILLILTLLNIWVFRKNMKPLYDLLAWFSKYQIGNKKALNSSTKISEFRKLNEAVMLSVERNEELYEQQKMFIGNASHEMQTPLAICLNRIEMIMEDESLTENHLEELSKIYHTLENLTRMNKSLLLLCKIENKQFAEDIQTVNINRLITNYLETFEEVYAYKNIHVEKIEKNDFLIDINESLAVMLVVNLLKNAFVHNQENGHIIIEINNDYFVVSSSAKFPLDESKIFQRFYQGSKKEGSTGLGLALVDTICKTNNLKVSYNFSDMMHNFKVSRFFS